MIDLPAKYEPLKVEQLCREIDRNAANPKFGSREEKLLFQVTEYVGERIATGLKLLNSSLSKIEASDSGRCDGVSATFILPAGELEVFVTLQEVIILAAHCLRRSPATILRPLEEEEFLALALFFTTITLEVRDREPHLLIRSIERTSVELSDFEHRTLTTESGGFSFHFRLAESLRGEIRRRAIHQGEEAYSRLAKLKFRAKLSIPAESAALQRIAQVETGDRWMLSDSSRPSTLPATVALRGGYQSPIQLKIY